MKHFFPLSFRHKVMLFLLLLMNVPFFLTGYLAKSLTHHTVMQEKEEKLLSFARALDTYLGPEGFAAILRRHGAEHASRDEKIAVLNRALHSITDTLGVSSPGLGIGYYSRDLDAILTYGPSALFGDAVGRSIPRDHPGHIVMRDAKPLVRSGTMVRGDIMNAMFPMVREGETVGYIWANELTTDVMAQSGAMTRNIFIIMLLCSGLTAGLLYLLSQRTVRDVDRIIEGVRAMRSDLTSRIHISGGELREVASSINAMAADIGKANEETSRAVSVLQSVLGNVDSAVYVCDPRTKTLVYVNEYLCKLLDRQDIQGLPCYEVLQGRSAPCPFCPQHQLFDEEEKPIFTTVRWETYNPLIKRDFLVTDRLVTWHDGRVLHMEVSTDVTDRKALVVAEATNLAQKEFLARMSHEIRTPMNGVLGMTRLAMQADPPPAQLEYLKKIQASASLLLGIINDILDFSRIEAGKLTIEKHPFNLHAMVANIKELIEPLVREKGLGFTIVTADSVPEYAVGDELRLSQVLLNLLSNAAKFTLSGSISLTLEGAPLPSGAFRLSCAVTDSGIGMSLEQQEALFQPFSQADSSTSRKFGGTGLGLSISKALVEIMGGSIHVDSEVGRGSRFSFFVDLGCVERSPEADEKPEAPWEHSRYDGHTFLLVEDNLINQEIALGLLAELGAGIDTADNGEEGLHAFLRKDYSLILMDVRMPVMDGLEATRRIRASGKHDAATVPVIAMTANVMREDREAGKEAGMNGHIAKPIDVNELKYVLFDALAAKNPKKSPPSP